jgi:16S rRNA (cytosine967-C5)-methyltransferase
LTIIKDRTPIPQIPLRNIILKALIKMDGGAYSTILLDSLIKANKFSERDKNFATACFYSVLERKLLFDFIIDTFGKSKPDGLVRAILRLALAEILCFDSTPDAVAVNEAVELAPKRAKGYVNGVLREFLRQKDDFTQNKVKPNPSLAYSIPQWLILKWEKEYGTDETVKILESSLGVAPVFDRGGYVQDESSYQACVLLAPQPNEVVIDICAAPGGKSFTMARLMNNTGRIIACDVNPKRLRLVNSVAATLKLDIIETLVNDGKKHNPDLPTADRVLCDVPCSGLGVIRRKPEIKYKDPAAFAGLPEIQLQILQTSCEYVKPDGMLMYSTCTLSRDENDCVVEAFLDANKQFRLIEMKTVFPSKDGGDGFFTALMRKL